MRLDRFAPVALACCLLVSAWPQDAPGPDGWEQKLERAQQHLGRGGLEQALDLARAALDQAEHEDVDDETLIQPLLFLTTLEMMAGDFDAAEPLSLRAYEIAEAQLVAARGRVATVLKYLGAIHAQRGDLAAAQGVYERAVEISEEAVGPEHPETAKHVGNLGSLLLRRGREAEAEALLERALAIWDAQPAPHAIYTAGDLTNLAALRAGQGRLDDAVALQARAVSIQEGALGADDPRLQETLRGYARTLREAGRDAQAAEVEARLGDG